MPVHFDAAQTCVWRREPFEDVSQHSVTNDGVTQFSKAGQCPFCALTGVSRSAVTLHFHELRQECSGFRVIAAARVFTGGVGLVHS